MNTICRDSTCEAGDCACKGFALVEAIISLSVLALAAVVAASFLTQASPAWNRSTALRDAPSAVAALSLYDVDALPMVGRMIRDEAGEWLVIADDDPRAHGHDGLQYRVILRESDGGTVAVLQWAPGANRPASEEDGEEQLPHWSRLAAVILEKQAGE